MTLGPLVDYEFLEAFHDGTMTFVSHDASGGLVLRVDIEYLAAFLAPEAETFELRLTGCTRAWWEPADQGAASVDLLASPCPSAWECTLLSVESLGSGAARIHGDLGSLVLSCERMDLVAGEGQKITKGDLLGASRMYWSRWEQRGKAAQRGLGIRMATQGDSDALGRLYREHLAHLARFNPLVNPSTELQSDWFEKPDKLFPWLFVQRATEEVAGEEDRLDEEQIVGFALVGGQHLARAMGSPADYLCFEFYVAQSSRRLGVGRCALGLLFDRYPGTWSIDVLPDNPEAVGFWGSVLAPYRPELSPRVEDDGARLTRHLLHSALAVRPWP